MLKELVEHETKVAPPTLVPPVPQAPHLGLGTRRPVLQELTALALHHRTQPSRALHINRSATTLARIRLAATLRNSARAVIRTMKMTRPMSNRLRREHQRTERAHTLNPCTSAINRPTSASSNPGLPHHSSEPLNVPVATYLTRRSVHVWISTHSSPIPRMRPTSSG